MTAHRPVDLIDLQLDDFEQFIVEQLVENDDLVETVDELRIERLSHRRHHHLFHLLARGIGICLETERALLLNEARADVRGHDDDGVLEIDGVAERVGQDAVFKNLKQDVENVRMRFFDLIKQQN